MKVESACPGKGCMEMEGVQRISGVSNDHNISSMYEINKE